MMKTFPRKGLLLTNSNYSKEVIKRYLGLEAEVVYPPVDVEFFSKALTFKKEPIVVSCGRMSPEKRFHLIPYIASKLPDVRFYIISNIVTEQELRYFLRIKALSKRLAVENVKFSLGLPSIMLLLYKKASVYLHLNFEEAFGISVPEAMAAGLIPVVPKNCGPSEIVDFGRYGYCFKDLDDCISKIKEALNGSKDERMAVHQRAWEYSKSRFHERVIGIVEGFVA